MTDAPRIRRSPHPHITILACYASIVVQKNTAWGGVLYVPVLLIPLGLFYRKSKHAQHDWLRLISTGDFILYGTIAFLLIASLALGWWMNRHPTNETGL